MVKKYALRVKDVGRWLRFEQGTPEPGKVGPTHRVYTYAEDNELPDKTLIEFVNITDKTITIFEVGRIPYEDGTGSALFIINVSALKELGKAHKRLMN